MTQTTPAGWYPDPDSPGQQRYWDGAAWTEHVAPGAIPRQESRSRTSQAAPAGWYPNPDDLTQQRYWDGAAWTQNVAPTPPTEPTPQDVADPDSTPQPVADTPVLQAWKPSVGFSILGVLIGTPAFGLLGFLIAIGPMVLAYYLIGSDALTAPIAGIVGNVLIIIYTAKFYPSYFTDRPVLRSNRAISFANLMIGTWLFGFIWNGNLTKRRKGVSHVVMLVVSVLACAYFVLQIPVALSSGAISGSASSSDDSSPDLIDLGGISAGVPAPAGFVRVTPAMKELSAFQDQFVWPGNELLAAFIPEEVAPAALAGEVPELKRHFLLQVQKEGKSHFVSESEFLQLREYLRSNINGKDMSETQDKVNDLLAASGVELSDPVVSPAHIDSDRIFAFSTLQKMETKTAEGTSVRVQSVTSTSLYVNQRVLFLYVYGGKDDLEWTRDQSRDWANAILSANPGIAVEGIQPLERTEDADVYTDAETGASFVIPDTWSEQQFVRAQQGRKAKFRVPGAGGTAFYDSGDLWDIIPEGKRPPGMAREDIDNMDDWSEEDLIGLVR